MPHYQLQTEGTTLFRLLADEQPVATLRYPEWYSLKADLHLPGDVAVLARPTGFWGTTIRVTRQGEVLLNLRMHWDGSIVLKPHGPTAPPALVVKSQGVFKQAFVLLDKSGTMLAEIKPHYAWNKLTPHYHLLTTAAFEALPDLELLLLIFLHCVNYYLMMMASAVVLAS